MAIAAGIMSIINNAVFKPSVASAAYDKDPRIPAPPVPEDHVETTFLNIKFNSKCTYFNLLFDTIITYCRKNCIVEKTLLQNQKIGR